jgi:hypothetical protein
MKSKIKQVFLVALLVVLALFGFIIPLHTAIGADPGPGLCIGYIGQPQGTKRFHLLLGQYSDYQNAKASAYTCNGGQIPYHAKLYL